MTSTDLKAREKCPACNVPRGVGNCPTCCAQRDVNELFAKHGPAIRAAIAATHPPEPAGMADGFDATGALAAAYRAAGMVETLAIMNELGPSDFEEAALAAITTAHQAGIAECQSDAREAFLNMLADARDWHCEPDGDETGDHTTYHLITHWRQLADLCDTLGIEGPRYMETWDDALARAIAAPPVKLKENSRG